MRPLPALAMAALLLTAGCGRSGGLPDPASIPDPSLPSRVLVLEGDSYVIDGRHIQLAGGTAPQSIPGARCWAEALASKYAIKRVKQLFAEARKLEVHPTGQVDNARRHLARVIVDNQDFAVVLKGEGLLATPADGSFRWCSPISEERDGAPLYSSMFEPGRS